MNDSTNTPAVSRDDDAGFLFTLLGGFVCMLAGMGLVILLESATGLRETFLVARAGTDMLENLPFILGFVVIVTARPAGWAQWGLYGLVITLQSVAYYLGISMAGLARMAVAPDGRYLAQFCVFLPISWVVLALGYLALKRGGTVLVNTDYRSISRWAAFAMPGFVLCGLLLDQVGAAGAMPALIEDAEFILLLAMVFPAWVLANKAQPTRPSHWALLGILMMVLQVSTVFVAMVTAWLVTPFTDGDSMLMPVVAVVPVALLPMAFIRIAKAVTGSGGPWRPEKSGGTEKVEGA